MENEKTNGSDAVESQSTVAMCQFTCKACSGQIVARVPTMRVFNFPELSGIAIAHERMAKCSKCETLYIPLIGNVSEKGNIQFVWKPLPGKLATVDSIKDLNVENSRKM